MSRTIKYTTEHHRRAYVAYRESKGIFSEARRRDHSLPTVSTLISWSRGDFHCSCPWHNYERLDVLLRKVQNDIIAYTALTPAERKKLFEHITGAITILDDIDPIELAVMGNLDSNVVMNAEDRVLKKKQLMLNRTYFKELVVDDSQRLLDYHATRTLILSHIFNAKFPELDKYLKSQEKKFMGNLAFKTMGEAIKALAEVDKQISFLTGEHSTKITET